MRPSPHAIRAQTFLSFFIGTILAGIDRIYRIIGINDHISATVLTFDHLYRCISQIIHLDHHFSVVSRLLMSLRTEAMLLYVLQVPIIGFISL